MEHKTQDISVIIPTYNRTEDLDKTLNSFKEEIKNLNEILIIDQSKNEETKNLVKKLKNSKIKYIHSDTPSLTQARNLGIKKSSNKSKIICFLDDDVTLGKNYFEKIVEVFNEYPDAIGVSAYQKQNKINLSGEIYNLIKRLFLIENLKKNSARVLSVYGNEYPSVLDKIISSQWLTGFNMCYNKNIFKNFNFDENLKKYSLAEDFDFSYRLWKKYPGSLFITPFAKIEHRASSIERYPTEKMSYMNQINHFYLNYKNFNSNFIEKVNFIWCLFGITLLRSCKFLAGFKKQDWFKLKYFIKSLIYVNKNNSKIGRGDLDIIS